MFYWSHKSYGKNQRNAPEEGLCKVDIYVMGVFPFSVVTIVGSQVQPGTFPTPALHPRPATLPDPRHHTHRSHGVAQSCSSLAKLQGVGCRGREKLAGRRKGEHSLFLAAGDIRALSRGMMSGSKVSPELSTPSCWACSAGMEGDGRARCSYLLQQVFHSAFSAAIGRQLSRQGRGQACGL